MCLRYCKISVLDYPAIQRIRDVRLSFIPNNYRNLIKKHLPFKTEGVFLCALFANQWFVAYGVRIAGIFAKTGAFVLFIFFKVAFKPNNFAIAFIS